MTRLYPLAAGKYSISSGFGPREGGFHAGLDFAAPDGTPFYACQAGTVQYIGAADGYGQWIVIDSDDEQGAGCVEYGHMWDAFKTGLRVGSKVAAGQLIGYVGSNGGSTGPHLHISVWPRGHGDGQKIDPAAWLKGAGHPGTPKPNPTPLPVGSTPMGAPAFREIDMMGNRRSNRFGAAVVFFLGHTEEGNATAQGLAASGNSSGNFSYHYVCRDGILVDMVDTDYASWSVLDANPRSINFVFAGSRASFTREQWLARRNDIAIFAWIAVQDSKKYPIGKVVNRGRNYPLGNRPCIADHYFVTRVLGIGDHSDLGPNFPWDVAEQYVREYLTGVPAVPPENLINKAAAKAAAWIGKRLAPEGVAGETITPDGRGKWVKYENGYVYFTDTTGAHAIPNYIFHTWYELGAEKGVAGYPTGSHSVLAGGEVQGFEGGAIYRRGHPGQNEQVGVLIGGKIREKWNKSGFENGPYGYPISMETKTKSGAIWQQFEKGRMAFSPDHVVGLFTQDGPDIIN